MYGNDGVSPYRHGRWRCGIFAYMIIGFMLFFVMRTIEPAI
jgi:hypothetical protein